VDHTGVFSGLPEVFFNDSDSTSRCNPDFIRHADEGTPEREQGSTGNVLASIDVDEIYKRTESTKKKRRKLRNVPSH
jgi:hypothetical protein